MKPTGIIRRVDENGRVVIPKAIREALKIEENRHIMEKCHFMTQYGYGYTFCITPVTSDGSTRAGFAKCSKDDEWNTNIGRVAAYANAMGYDLNKMIGYEG